eukprot:3315043-Pyramimonas_sp.AAC.1
MDLSTYLGASSHPSVCLSSCASNNTPEHTYILRDILLLYKVYMYFMCTCILYTYTYTHLEAPGEVDGAGGCDLVVRVEHDDRAAQLGCLHQQLRRAP